MSDSATSYELLDSGNGQRLERVGPYRLVRQAAQAFWQPRLSQSEWDMADAIFHRSEKGGGHWEFTKQLPESWPVMIADITMTVMPTGFGHIGLFPEQLENWRMIASRIRESGRPMEVMNLFAYTGGATLVAAAAGASVCHLDSSKGVVAWARENAAVAGLADKSIRWMVEDVLKFLGREQRRGRRYQGLIIDPPTFGRGSKGEVWKIERDLPMLLSACKAVLADDADFLTLSTYSPKFTPMVLANILSDTFGDLPGSITAEEMWIPETDGRKMPSGVTVRWLADTKEGKP